MCSIGSCFELKPSPFLFYLFQENADIPQLETVQGIRKKKNGQTQTFRYHILFSACEVLMLSGFMEAVEWEIVHRIKWWSKGEIWVPAWSLTSYLNICLFASKEKEICFSFSCLLLHYIITTMDTENIVIKSRSNVFYSVEGRWDKDELWPACGADPAKLGPVAAVKPLGILPFWVT